MQTPAIEMKGITKIYPNGVVANKDVDFSVDYGEIHAVMGENGAGKSTLMKMLFGLEKIDKGEVLFEGKPIRINSPAEAIKLKIGMVHQEFMLVPSLTVSENMMLREEPKKGIFINRAKAVEETRRISQMYQLPIDPDTRVEDLPVGMKQRVEILKALYRGARILILDEPTAVLTPQETEELFRQLILLKEHGHTVIFISHKIREVKQICDRITIMKNGRSMGVYDVKDITESDISRLMVGREIKMNLEKKQARPRDVVLSVEHLYHGYGEGRLKVNDVSFTVRSGEILGIAGVEGNGQRELLECITGLQPIQRGKIRIKHNDVSRMSIRKIRDIAKTAYIPQDRLLFGVASEATIKENLLANRLSDPEISKAGIVKDKKLAQKSRELIQEFTVKCDSEKQTVDMLSGGNIQKVVVARELSMPRDLIVIDQPSRGIDIGATKFIHEKIFVLRDRDAAILISSADLAEIMELSDSLIVMYEGEIAAYFKSLQGITEETLGEYMLGIKKQTPEEIKEAFYEQ
ncbi:MAG: ABC transporter ATP-binding protein [Clostridiales bacterium]|nr:ABC transporter ATP-binding protein [Clostridiales bacterium]